MTVEHLQTCKRIRTETADYMHFMNGHQTCPCACVNQRSTTHLALMLTRRVNREMNYNGNKLTPEAEMCLTHRTDTFVPAPSPAHR